MKEIELIPTEEHWNEYFTLCNKIGIKSIVTKEEFMKPKKVLFG